MRDLKTIVVRELYAGGVYRNSHKQAAMERVIQRLIERGLISKDEYATAYHHGLEYVGMTQTEVTS